ncbi:hypothetical protein C7999DRAFT_36722, partial [Corynascus novoguineensis]
MRDVVFNEEETFSGRLEELYDDIKEVDLAELSTLLQDYALQEQTDEQVNPALAPRGVEDEDLAEDTIVVAAETAGEPDGPATTETAGEPDGPATAETAGEPDGPATAETAGEPDGPATAETAGEPDGLATIEAAREPDGPATSIAS